MVLIVVAGPLICGSIRSCGPVAVSLRMFDVA